MEAVPAVPVDMRRSIARQAQPMNADGSFTARVIVDPPEHTTGDNWGIYVYPGAGSVDARQEFFIPINYSPEPGPNTTPTVPSTRSAARRYRGTVTISARFNVEVAG